MAFKLAVFAALVAVANAGYLGAPALSYAAAPAVAYAAPYHASAIGSQTQSVVRSADGNSAISTYSKAVDTAYSSVRKYDTRVSNDAIAYPAVAKVAAPLAYSAPAYAHAAPLAYSAPAYAHAAPLAYSAPAYAKVASPLAYSAPAVAHGGLLGVAYSAAPSVAHISYSNPLVSYAY